MKGTTPVNIVTAIDVHRALDPVTVDDVRVKQALKVVNQADVLKEQRSRWSVSLWNRTDDINGVGASYFLERDDMTDGEVYLISKDGNVLYFQPHDPRKSGHAAMSTGTGIAIGEEQADEFARADAYAEVLARVLQSL